MAVLEAESVKTFTSALSSQARLVPDLEHILVEMVCMRVHMESSEMMEIHRHSTAEAQFARLRMDGIDQVLQLETHRYAIQYAGTTSESLGRHEMMEITQITKDEKLTAAESWMAGTDQEDPQQLKTPEQSNVEMAMLLRVNSEKTAIPSTSMDAAVPVKLSQAGTE
jgi:hypothetical protein